MKKLSAIIALALTALSAFASAVPGASVATVPGASAATVPGASAPVITIDTRRPVADISPQMYGIFFEDINYGADGGLYAELVKNRSFEFPQSLMGWNTIGGVEVRNDGPFERCPHYVRMSFSGKRDQPTAIENEGFLGMTLRGPLQYRFSLWARCPEGGSSLITLRLRDASERWTLADTTITISGSEWRKYAALVDVPRTAVKGSLQLSLARNGEGRVVTTDVEHISLFPTDTWKGRENGLRRDLAQRLADLRPGVMRFPGGCIVEGATLDTRYNWKNSVGPVENRPTNENRWNYDLRNTRYDYYQSYGLGFFEFFQLCEDMGCEALPVISCGMACQFNNDIKTRQGGWIVHPDSLQQYVQDAIDLIEFCNGDPQKNEWARLRADMGHPAPFNLKYLAIGNEQWGPYYKEQLQAFLAPIRRQYPEIRIIGTAGPWADGKEYEELWQDMRSMNVDLVDEHYYRDEQFFLSQADRYDKYPRKGPKVFAGEYACHGKGKKFNRYYSALCEAALMTGLERNADIVRMATYAPLFAHVDGWQWRPDMIWFDNERSVCTSSYYVQQMYSHNRGTHVLRTTVPGASSATVPGASAATVPGASAATVLGASAPGNTDSLYATSSREGSYIIVKIVNVSTSSRNITLDLRGARKGVCTIERTLLTGPSPDSDNTLENPTLIAPVTTVAEAVLPTLGVELPPLSFAVYRIKPTTKNP